MNYVLFHNFIYFKVDLRTMKNCEICGRERGDMNPTNWNRHVKSCRLKTTVTPKLKRNLNNASIKEFFTKKIKLERIGKLKFIIMFIIYYSLLFKYFIVIWRVLLIN